jgi:CheY-like chemotaxis protein
MPKMNGIELLKALKEDERLKDIPAVVVSTSAEKQDVTRSVEFGAVAYIVKCFSYGEFRERMKAIQAYLGAGRPAETLEPARV